MFGLEIANGVVEVKSATTGEKWLGSQTSYEDRFKYERRTCPECGFDEMKVDSCDASVLCCRWNVKLTCLPPAV
jgi:hypothetical protein